MQQLLYAAEVRSIKDIDIPKTDVKPAELKLAQQLIEQQSSDKFDPAAYNDEVRERIEAAVQKKVEGQEITMAEEPEQGAQVIDLMEALRASLEKKPAKKAQSRTPRRRPRKLPRGRPPRNNVHHVRGAGGRKAPAPAAQHDPRAGPGRIRLAVARAAQCAASFRSRT